MEYHIPLEFKIPLEFEEGIYGINSLGGCSGGMLELEFDVDYKILTYTVPGYEYGSIVKFYSFPGDRLEEKLEVSYNRDGHLKKVTARINDKEKLLYIYYENIEDAKDKIKKFAELNADIIIEKICECRDKVSRLFTEKYSDGENLDFHAKIGTKEQKAEIEKKSKYPDTVDYPGDYPSEMIYGDNSTLTVMVLCADKNSMDFFGFATEIMEECIKEKAVAKLDKAEDFKFFATEYD